MCEGYQHSGTVKPGRMHVVVLPMPLQGHAIPSLALAKLLLPHGFSCTLVLTEELAEKLPPTPSVPTQGDCILQYAVIPFPRAPPLPRGCPFDFRTARQRINSIFRPASEALLRSLMSSPQGVSLIIADSFLPWAQHIATELNIPAFHFFTSNARTLAVTLHADILISKGIVPVTDPDRIVDCVRGLPPMRAGDLTQLTRTNPSLAVDVSKATYKAAGVIFNTVYELEREPLEVIKDKVPIYSIGPMLLMHREPEKSKGRETTIALGAEQRKCLEWLDTRPASSVLFIAFGTSANVSGDQIKELAQGLEASGQAFLWVIRIDADDMPLSTLLPEGFTERTKDRGLIISWAPQLEVLSHAAVGGFFTHCGWNSLTENLSLGGVPMICYPQVAEQRLNKLLVVDKWKVGLELQEEDGLVKKAEVQKAVTQLMQDEVGRELRKRAMELKETVARAVQGGGSSQNYLKALVEDMKKLGSGAIHG